jgi:enoyl-CoA hydratase/carnithine racemase
MINDFTSALRLWNNSDSAQVIIFMGGPISGGKKSFCAGGDVVGKGKCYGAFIIN